MTFPESFKVGFGIPQVFPDSRVDGGQIRRVAMAAEEAGFDSLWTQDQLLGRANTVEPLSMLAYLAAVTTRVRLGVAVLVLPVRNPVQLAKTLSSIDVLSGGRLIAGVGLGGEWDAAAFGIPGARRVRRFLDVLGAVNALWTQHEAIYDGEWHRLERSRMEPKPLQRPRPPVWFGARVEPALRRAVRLGDGWMGAGSSSVADFANQAAIVRRLLEQADRDPAGFAVSKRVYLAIDEDADRAERRLRAWFGHNYGDPEMAPRVSIWGPAEHCHEQIEALVDAGAGHLLLNPVFDFEEHLDALGRYARGT